VHARGPRGKSHIGAIVDDDRCTCPGDHGDDPTRQRVEPTVVEVSLAEMNQVHTGSRRDGHEMHETLFVRFRQLAAIRDETDDGMTECPHQRLEGSVGPCGAVEALRLEANAPPSSARPARTVTSPTPETAPRAYGLATRYSMTGAAFAKKLRSQKADHGATTRINPASRK
jgi:hypothetical protein